MKRYGVLILVCVAVIVGALLYYFYGGSTAPAGQRELVRLDAVNFSQLRQDFNAGVDRVRLIAMLSPT